MRLIIGVLLALVLSSMVLVPAAFAAKFKVPKSACYTLSSNGGPYTYEGQTLIMASKYHGLKFKSASGNKKLYTVQGAISGAGWWNITGSGYITDDGDRFDADFSTKVEFEIVHCSYFLHQVSGASMCCRASGDGFSNSQCYNLIEADCKSIDDIN